MRLYVEYFSRIFSLEELVFRTGAKQLTGASDSHGVEFQSLTVEDSYSKSVARCKFEVNLLRNVINYLIEETSSCMRRDEYARRRYREKRRILQDIAAPGAHLIICDCARSLGMLFRPPLPSGV